MKSFLGKLVKLNGIVKYKTLHDEKEYTKFKESLIEGDLIDVHMEVVNNDGTIPQIRKIHMLFRIISEFSGYTVEEVKLLVKEECGFAYNKQINGKYYVIPLKSIGDMSKIELANLIEATIKYAMDKYDLILD